VGHRVGLIQVRDLGSSGAHVLVRCLQPSDGIETMGGTGIDAALPSGVEDGAPTPEEN
jgi:hypothetical protein